MAKKGTGRRGRKAEQARKRRQQTMWVLGVVVVAVLIAGVMIVLSLVDGDEGATSVPPPVEGTESGLTADGYPYLGSPDAPVKMIEYSDYFCGHCGQFNADKAPQIEEEYVATGKVQFIVPYYALGKDARLVVVEASACAADQGRFFEYRRLLFANSRELAETPPAQWESLLVKYAQQVGLDTATFESCWDQGKHQGEILASINQALQEGVNSTPTFFINGQVVRGNQPYAAFQEAIEAALAEANQ